MKWGWLARLRFIKNAFASTKHEMLISLGMILALTGVLSVIFYIAERIAQPDVYTNYWDALVWAYSRYMEGGDGVFDGAPVTVVGKIIAYLLGWVGIAIVAVPAGLIGSAFMDAITEQKHDEELNRVRMRLQKAFSPSLARRVNDYLREKGDEGSTYMVPMCKSIVDLQVKYHLDTASILEACDRFPEFSLANMASVQTEAESPVDRLVVLKRWLNTSYGCCIDRGSKVTIVVTSAHVELATEWFGYYLAEFGGFNFICRSQEEDPENAASYYNMKDKPDDVQQQDFYRDLKRLSQGDDKWNIYLLHRVTNISKGGNHIHFSSSMREGKECTVVDRQKYQAIKDAIVEMFADYDFNFSSEDSDRFALTKNNVAYRLQRDGVSCDSFTIRLGAHIMAKHTFRSLIAYRMAEQIKMHIETK